MPRVMLRAPRQACVVGTAADMAENEQSGRRSSKAGRGSGKGSSTVAGLGKGINASAARATFSCGSGFMAKLRAQLKAQQDRNEPDDDCRPSL